MMRPRTRQSLIQPHQYSLRQLLPEYKHDLEAANRSRKTIERYSYSINGFADFLEWKGITKPVRELGKKELNMYVRHLQNSTRWAKRANDGKDMGKLSPSTVQDQVRDLKAFWSWLTREGYVEKNVLAKFTLPKVPQYLIQILSYEQIKKILSAIDNATSLGARYYCIILILLDTGMRISELVNIKISDVDITNGLIKILGKGQKEREVPFSRLTRKFLIRYIDNYRLRIFSEDSPFLFPKVDGSHIYVNSVQQYLRRLARTAGLENIKLSPHIFRHTFATRAIANGANVYAVKEIMGHKSLQTTMKYTHLDTADLKAQHNKFSPVEHLMKDNHNT